MDTADGDFCATYDWSGVWSAPEALQKRR